jgi:hypothetical protein
MDAEHFRRRHEKRRNTKPKGVGDILKPLATAQFTPPRVVKNREMPMKARSQRYRGRTLVVGRTAFVFDKEGICVHTPRGNSGDDFKMMVKSYHGVDWIDPPTDPDEDPTMPLTTDPTLLAITKQPPAAPAEPMPTKVCACGTKMWGHESLPDQCPACQAKEELEALQAAVAEEEQLPAVTEEITVTAFNEPGLAETSVELEAVAPEPTTDVAEEAGPVAPVPTSKGRRRRAAAKIQQEG